MTVEDVAAAIDHSPASTPRLDLGRVVAIGHSAGGQLALWAASARVRSGACASPASSRRRASTTCVEADRLDLGEGATAGFMGGHADDVPDRYADASPIERLPSGVPRLLVHGDADERVPVGAVRIVRRPRRARPTTRSTLVVRAPETTTSSTSTSRAARGRTSWGGWGGSTDAAPS